MALICFYCGKWLGQEKRPTHKDSKSG